MKKILIGLLILLPVFCFAQRVNITGGISLFDSEKQYRIQVGAFRETANAERAFNSLTAMGLKPVYEDHADLQRVVLTGFNTRDLPLLLDAIYSAGFNSVWMSEEKNSSTVSIVVRGGGAVTEINEDIKEPMAIVQTIPSFSPSDPKTYQANAPLVFFFNNKIYLDSVEGNIDVSIEERPVDGTVIIDGGDNGYAVLTFTPKDPFPAGKEISVILRKGLQNDGGNEMLEDIYLSYITEQGSETYFGNNFGFEEGSDGIVFTGDGAIGTARGSLVPYEGDHYAAISTGSHIVSNNGMAINGRTSQIELGPIQESFSSIAFYYDFISSEFNEYVGSKFDDTAMVTIFGPRGTYTEIITSVNMIGTNNARFDNYPGMPDSGDSYAGHTGWLPYRIEGLDVGSPAYIIFSITDVGDDALTSVLAIDALELE